MKKLVAFILALALALALSGCNGYTEDDLNKVQRESRQEGYDTGYNEGYGYGFDDGFDVGYKKGIITERETPDSEYEKLKEQAAKATTAGTSSAKMKVYSFANAPEETKTISASDGYRYAGNVDGIDKQATANAWRDPNWDGQPIYYEAEDPDNDSIFTYGTDADSILDYIRDNPHEFNLYTERDLELAYESGLEDSDW